MSPIFSSVSYNSINVQPGVRFNRYPLGTQIEGGRLICRSSNVAWIVAPNTTEVSRTWYCRNDAVTTAQAAAACGDWFVPTCGQLQNPGYTCRIYWDTCAAAGYWSNTEDTASNAWNVLFFNGTADIRTKSNTICVRAFRCVTY